MQAGKLRHRITIQQVTETVDAAGGLSKTWSTHKECWAEIRPLERGRELLKAQQIHADINHIVTCRYVSGVTPKMRVLFGTRIFKIRSVSNADERDVTLILYCSEDV